MSAAAAGPTGEQGEAPGAAARTETTQMLLNVLVLQREAVRAQVATFHRQQEAFVQQTRRHPLSFAPMAARHAAPVELPALSEASPSSASGLTVSKELARLVREHCDDQACLLSREHMRDFLAGAKALLKMTEDRFGAVYVLDRTLQASQAAARAAGVAMDATVAGVEGLHKSFEQEKGFELLTDWFVEACSYRDEPRRAIATAILRVLERNRPVVAFTRKRCIQVLRQLHGSNLIASRPVRTKCGAVIELMRDA